MLKILKALSVNRKMWVVFLGSLLASFVLEWWVRECGFLLVSDSYQYLSAARSFREAGIFLSPDGSYYTIWPPLFPMILSVFDEPLNAAIWINALSKIVMGGCLFYLSNHLLKEFFTKSLYLILALIANVSLVWISVFFLSEILFMGLVYVNIVLTLQPRTRSTYFFMVLTGFLFCLQRNAGLFIIGGTSIWMLIEGKLSVKRKLFSAALYFIVCTSGQWLWNFYNASFIPEEVVFYEHPFLADAGINLLRVLSALGWLFLPLQGWHSILSGALLIIAVFFLLHTNILSDSRWQLLILIIVCYIGGYIAMPELDVHEMDRYFSVVVPIIFLLCLKASENIPGYFVKKFFVHVCLILWLCYPLLRTGKNALQWHERSCAKIMKVLFAFLVFPHSGTFNYFQ